MPKYRIFDRFILDVSTDSIFASIRIDSDDEDIDISTSEDSISGAPFTVDFLYTIGVKDKMDDAPFKIAWQYENPANGNFTNADQAPNLTFPDGTFQPTSPRFLIPLMAGGTRAAEPDETQSARFVGIFRRGADDTATTNIDESGSNMRYRGEIYIEQNVESPPLNQPPGVSTSLTPFDD